MLCGCTVSSYNVVPFNFTLLLISSVGYRLGLRVKSTQKRWDGETGGRGSDNLLKIEGNKRKRGNEKRGRV